MAAGPRAPHDDRHGRAARRRRGSAPTSSGWTTPAWPRSPCRISSTCRRCTPGSSPQPTRGACRCSACRCRCRSSRSRRRWRPRCRATCTGGSPHSSTCSARCGRSPPRTSASPSCSRNSSGSPAIGSTSRRATGRRLLPEVPAPPPELAPLLPATFDAPPIVPGGYVLPVPAPGGPAGFLLALERPGVAPAGLAVAQHIATVAALQLSIHRHERETLRREGAETLGELLQGVLDPASARRRLARLGFGGGRRAPAGRDPCGPRRGGGGRRPGAARPRRRRGARARPAARAGGRTCCSAPARTSPACSGTGPTSRSG